MTAQDVQRRDLFNLMLPGFFNLPPAGRIATTMVVADTQTKEMQRRTSQAIRETADATAAVADRSVKQLTDGDLASRPNLANAVQLAPDLRTNIESSATAIDRRRRADVQRVETEAVDVLVKVADNGGPIAPAELDAFPAIKAALEARGPDVLGQVVILQTGGGGGASSSGTAAAVPKSPPKRAPARRARAKRAAARRPGGGGGAPSPSP
jgi:hypothetical protein